MNSNWVDKSKIIIPDLFLTLHFLFCDDTQPSLYTLPHSKPLHHHTRTEQSTTGAVHHRLSRYRHIDINHEYLRYNSPSESLVMSVSRADFKNSSLSSRVILNTKSDESVSNNVLFHITSITSYTPH